MGGTAPYDAMDWIEGVRGPIVVVPCHLLEAWTHVERRFGSSSVPLVPGVVDLVSIGNGSAMVLRSPDSTTWQARADGGVVLTHLRGLGDEDMLDIAATLPESAWTHTHTSGQFAIGEEGLVLFDGVAGWSEAFDTSLYMKGDIAAGRYNIDVIPTLGSRPFEMRLIRFRRAAGHH